MGTMRLIASAVTVMLLSSSLLVREAAGAAAKGQEDPLCSDLPRNATLIVRENCLPGSDSREWDVSGAGDHSLQGFASDIR